MEQAIENRGEEHLVAGQLDHASADPVARRAGRAYRSDAIESHAPHLHGGEGGRAMLVAGRVLHENEERS
jgi:hypothetical protein